MNPNTLALASQYGDLSDKLSALALGLERNGQIGAARTVKRAADSLDQASQDLSALDAIDQLSDAADRNTMQILTDSMAASNAAIGKAESRVTAIVTLVASLVSCATALSTGSIRAALSSAATALDKIRAFAA